MASICRGFKDTIHRRVTKTIVMSEVTIRTDKGETSLTKLTTVEDLPLALKSVSTPLSQVRTLYSWDSIQISRKLMSVELFCYLFYSST